MKKNNKMSEPRLSGLNDELELKTKKNHSNHINQTNQSSDNMQAWEIKKLGEVCENLDSKRIPITQSKRTKGDIPYYGASGIVDYVSDYIFDEDLLCVSEDGANLLARTYPIAFSISGKTWVNNHAHVLRFKNFSTQKFVELYLNSIRVDDYVSGMAQPKLNQAMLNKIPIPLPPLPEQQRIVSILDKAFAAIAKAKANAEQNLKNAKELFESYLENCLNHDSNDLLDYPDSKKENKKKSSNQLNQKNDVLSPSKYQSSDKWEVKKLGEIADIIMGQSPKGETYNQNGEGVPLINGPVEFGSEPFSNTIKSKWTTAPTKFCKKKDLILCVRGSTTGRINIAGFDACIGRGVAAIRYEKHQEWINYFILSSRQKIYNLGTGATFPNVSADIIKNLKISLPPLATQQAIVRQLDALRTETQKLEAVYQQKIANLDELKKSILQLALSPVEGKAFAAELKTKQENITIKQG